MTMRADETCEMPSCRRLPLRVGSQGRDDLNGGHRPGQVLPVVTLSHNPAWGPGSNPATGLCAMTTPTTHGLPDDQLRVLLALYDWLYVGRARAPFPGDPPWETTIR